MNIYIAKIFAVVWWRVAWNKRSPLKRSLAESAWGGATSVCQDVSVLYEFVFSGLA